jgi:hypothetical protein
LNAEQGVARSKTKIGGAFGYGVAGGIEIPRASLIVSIF